MAITSLSSLLANRATLLPAGTTILPKPTLSLNTIVKTIPIGTTGLRTIDDVKQRFNDIHQAIDDLRVEKAQRWNELKDKSAAELKSIGIEYIDGSFFKNGIAYLTKNDIDDVTGRFSKLLDSTGNYMYDLTIPTGIMAAVVEGYGDFKSKAELEAMAREAYNAVKSDYNASNNEDKDDLIEKAINIIMQKYGPPNSIVIPNKPVVAGGSSPVSANIPSPSPNSGPSRNTDSGTSTAVPGATGVTGASSSTSVVSKNSNRTWLLLAVGVVVVVSIVIIIKYK